jgi:hypothetical protein
LGCLLRHSINRARIHKAGSCGISGHLVGRFGAMPVGSFGHGRLHSTRYPGAVIATHARESSESRP